MLLEKGANCLIKDRMGRVAMFYTAHCQDRELISMIHRKTDLVYSDEAWRTWEIYAAIYQNWTLFNYLAETYYSIDGLDHDGRGPCIYAAANKNYSFFKGRTDYWMEHADKDGRNVLMYAVAAADTAGLTYYLVNKYSTLIHKINRGKHH